MKKLHRIKDTDVIKVKLGDKILEPLPREHLDKLSRDDLIYLLETEIRLRKFIEVQVHELKEELFSADGQLYRVKCRLFARSSERAQSGTDKPSDEDKANQSETGEKPVREKAVKLPSERYPNADIIEKHITCEELPVCECCGDAMQDSGMTEVAEYLTVIPKKYVVVRQHRHKYSCGKCHGHIVTTPNIPRVIPGSSYSDALIVDAALSKYNDLIPMERYTEIAARQGFEGLPPQSLIQCTVTLSDFIEPAYELEKAETLAASVLLADETPHNMLEGDDTSHWYLWGFTAGKSCFFECHNTRSGDVAYSVLQSSNCKALLTDVYSGYAKAVRETNEKRSQEGKAPILVAYCNAHARRGFTKNEQDADVQVPEAKFMLDKYEKIYALESTTATKTKKGKKKIEKKLKSPQEILNIRSQMTPHFNEMKMFALAQLETLSNKSALAKAFNYFIKNFDGLTSFLTNPDIPIDNNASERLLRSHVVGRKTWYGTHSKDGAKAAAIHFTLVEACKLNKVNPRNYYADLINAIHNKEPIFTPKTYAENLKPNPYQSPP